MAATQIEIEALQNWIGNQETTTEIIAPFPSNAMAATLNRDDPPYLDGHALPPLWHWLHFLPIHKLRDGNYDGHAALGGFLPPVPLPRRMWAGGRLQFHASMRIGRELQKTSEVLSVSHKSGKSGPLVFVTVLHKIHDGDTLCLEEEHDIVYRAPPSVGKAPPAHKAADPRPAHFSAAITPDPVLLFRYSALTFNGHRIHYDQPFCCGTEGYDGLVVHGPLLATLMLDLLRREYPDARVSQFEFRARAPVTVPADSAAPFEVCGTRKGNASDLWIMRADGVCAMEGRASLDAPA